jgi:hypothetical protein
VKIHWRDGTNLPYTADPMFFHYLGCNESASTGSGHADMTLYPIASVHADDQGKFGVSFFDCSKVAKGVDRISTSCLSCAPSGSGTGDRDVGRVHVELTAQRMADYFQALKIVNPLPPTTPCTSCVHRFKTIELFFAPFCQRYTPAELPMRTTARAGYRPGRAERVWRFTV